MDMDKMQHKFRRQPDFCRCIPHCGPGATATFLRQPKTQSVFIRVYPWLQKIGDPFHNVHARQDRIAQRNSVAIVAGKE